MEKETATKKMGMWTWLKFKLFRRKPKGDPDATQPEGTRAPEMMMSDPEDPPPPQ